MTPRWLRLTVGGRKVHVARFRSMNMNTVIMTMADRDAIVTAAGIASR